MRPGGSSETSTLRLVRKIERLSAGPLLCPLLSRDLPHGCGPSITIQRDTAPISQEPAPISINPILKPIVVQHIESQEPFLRSSTSNYSPKKTSPSLSLCVVTSRQKKQDPCRDLGPEALHTITGTYIDCHQPLMRNN